ncbi:hypothetical protein AT727_02615 [Desulfitobacterium hafniense]|uniref:GHMP kinase n=1 Tax=Desulfitobacterium hafniense TaxID=49338 RepID=A0A0W1JQ17_DESHA|nr:hypothetical protein [Desulfitobacterium hafniense]KTE93866.1 hypothetical protein AT727_02615 [Desulfitobacterium hafniense]
MIISETPLRISFVGGGTDLPAFYQQYGGAVLSTTIDKYVYVIVKERYDDLIVLNYSEKEIVNTVDQIKHGIIREALLQVGIYKGIEITTIADIPSKGSGLGSSSSLAVGLLNALYAYIGITKDSGILAEEACCIEIERLGNPIGKQDQYAAAFGGLKLYEFLPDNKVIAKPLKLDLGNILELSSHLILVYTGLTRNASTILGEQNKKTKANAENLVEMSRMPHNVKDILESCDFDKFGEYLELAWMRKKALANQISSSDIDNLYEKGILAGAIGGKLLGAGGGGFILFYVPLDRQRLFLQKMRSEYKVLPFRFNRYGSRIIFNTGRNEPMI